MGVVGELLEKTARATPAAVAIANWASERGTPRAYLQVELSNDPARR